MKSLLLISLLVCLSLSTVVPRVTPIHSHVPRTYKVNLEDGPVTRWANIIHDYMDPLTKFMDYVALLPIPASFFNGVQYYAKNVYKQVEFVAEVEAIAKLSGFPFEKLFFLNFMYEFSTFKACTGILIRNKDGKILHGRNLDFEMWQILSKLVVNVEYYKAGVKVFSVDTVVGSVFALTGIRHGAFAINVDTRKAKHFYDDLISVMQDNATPTCWLLRKTLQLETSYLGALGKLKTQRIGGPVYYVLSGLKQNEASVIERDVDSVNAHYQLTDTNWFLVQTNYDRDYPDPLHDPRRIPVQKRLTEHGNNITEQILIDEFMSVWPTFNIATIMTAVMVPSSGYHNTTIWYGNNPEGEQTQ